MERSADYSSTLVPHPNYCHQVSMEDQGIDLTQVEQLATVNINGGTKALLCAIHQLFHWQRLNCVTVAAAVLTR